MTMTLLVVISATANALTNVSGGIFSNTTWTKANSPYIVTDTVVVFPGYTLTIEPGVEVRFDDDVMLEIRQGKLIAHGTSFDTIVFTSNSLTPVPGSWGQVNLNGGGMLSEFSYCRFQYAFTGLHSLAGTVSIKNSVFSANNTGANLFRSASLDSCDFINNNGGLNLSCGTVTNCNFSGNVTGITNIGSCICALTNSVFNNNTTGIYLTGGSLVPKISKIDSCIISHNTVGITGEPLADRALHIKNSIIDSNSTVGIYPSGWGNDSIINCQISHNGIGLDDSLSVGYTIKQSRIESNSIGIRSRSSFNQITCNRICNNSSFDFYLNSSYNSNVSGNDWCSTDSAFIASRIYDAYDNPSSGIITFMPIDTLQCYLAGTLLSISGIIISETGTPVSGVTVTLSGDDTQTDVTDTAGRYSFTVSAGGSYTITPSKSNDVVVNNGITASDILLMRRHILGNGALGSPYKIIAAAECNAAGNTQVSTNDILFTSQLILGQVTSYPVNRLWQFVSSDYVFPDITNPFPFPTTRTYTSITTNQTGQDFIGIKLGDVNGNWDAGTP